MFDVEYLDDLEGLYKTLSYTAVAHSLYVSPSTVSRHVGAVERALGVKLFDRTTHSVVPTDAGRALEPTLVEMGRLLDEAVRIARGYAALDDVRVKMSCPEFWLVDYLEPLLQFAASECPSLRVELESNTPVQGISLVEAGDCVVAFGSELPGALKPGVSVRHYTDEELVALVSPNCPLASFDEVTPAQLARYPLVLLDDGQGGYDRLNEWTLQIFRDQSERPREICYARQAETSRHAVVSCGGYTLAPRSMDAGSGGRLHLARIAGGPYAVPLGFYYRPANMGEALASFLVLTSRAMG